MKTNNYHNIKAFSFKTANHNDIRTLDFIYFFSFLFIIYLITIWYNGTLSVLSWHIGFIDPSTSFAESLIKLYNILWFVLMTVLFFVLVLLIRIIYLFAWSAKYYNKSSVTSPIIDYCLYAMACVTYYLDEIPALFNTLKTYNRLSSYKHLLNLWYGQPRVHQAHSYLYISDLSEYKNLEVTWCVLPAAVLLSLVSPTFSLIFSLDSCADPAFTIKAIGKQWYWTYSYDVTLLVDEKHPDFKKSDWFVFYIDLIRRMNNVLEPLTPGSPYPTLKSLFSKEYLEILEQLSQIDLNSIEKKVHYSITFDSVMITEDDLTKGTHRLLEVSERLVLPVGVPIRFIITSADVLHSWAVPALGIKVDGVPGRLNQFFVEIKKPGIYYGQCSELCGPLHAFMPIVVEAVPMKEFEAWLTATNNKLNS